MSWLFGRKKAKPKPQIDNSERKEMDRQAQQHKLNKQIAQMEQETEVLAAKLEKMELQVKALVRAKKKKKAMKKLQEVKMRREQLIKKENVRNFLVKTKIQLETMSDTVNLKDILAGVNKTMKEGSEANEQLIEEMENIKEYQEEQKEADEMLKDLMGPDVDEQDELEDMYAEFEQQEADELANEFDTIPTNIVQPQVQKPQVQVRQNIDMDLDALLNS